MKHILIYGPPAAGKLTIASELARLTGYGLLHNHLTLDPVLEIFDFGHPELTRLVVLFRSELIEAAARARVDGIISTFVYARPSDDGLLRDWMRRVRKHGGENHFVRLLADERTLLRRAPRRSRRLHKKIVTPRHLRDLLHRADLGSAVPFVKNLEIDTTKTGPKQAALRIKRHFRL